MTRYWYILDPEIAMVQLYVSDEPSAKTASRLSQTISEQGHLRVLSTRRPDASRFSQIVCEQGRLRLMPARRPNVREARFLWEAGKPPLSVPTTFCKEWHEEQCIYCGRQALPIHLMNSFSLPMYRPWGHTCRNCGKTLVIA